MLEIINTTKDLKVAEMVLTYDYRLNQVAVLAAFFDKASLLEQVNNVSSKCYTVPDWRVLIGEWVWLNYDNKRE